MKYSSSLCGASVEVREVSKNSSYFDLSSMPPYLSVLIQHLRHVNCQLPFGNEVMWKNPLYFVSSADSVWRTTGVGPWTDPVLVVLFSLLTCFCLLKAMVSSLICMKMTPMGCAIRLQRWSFRTASLPASMMWPGGCVPTGSS